METVEVVGQYHPVLQSFLHQALDLPDSLAVVHEVNLGLVLAVSHLGAEEVELKQRAQLGKLQQGLGLEEAGCKDGERVGCVSC